MTSTSWRGGLDYQYQSKGNTPMNRGFQFRKVLKAIQENVVFRAFWETFQFFCSETTLHGMKHIFGTNSDYSRWHKRLAVRISRILWFLSCVAGVFVGVYMMNLVWIRFQESPTITTIETTSHPIWFVPFPAVTICNINKVYAPNTVNITGRLIERGISRDRIQKFYEKIPNLITPVIAVDEEFLYISSILQDMGYNTESLMTELAQPCENLLKYCFWKGTQTPCNELFKLSKSSEGICCSFNYKALKRSLEADTDFLNGSQKIYYVSGSGRNMGLNVLLDVEKQHSVAFSKSVYGADVLIHDPEEFPQASLSSAVVQPGREVSLTVVPTVIDSKRIIRDLPVAERKCLFSDEKKLRATAKYSVNSCMAECRVNFIIEKCNCLPFLYPETPAIENKNRQCELSDVTCLKNYRTFFASVQPPEGTPGFNTSEEIGISCNCFRACSETMYGLNVIDVQRSGHIPSKLFPNTDMTNMTNLVVYFKDYTCTQYMRDVYMTWDGLFAAFGGIFGLCLGGSVLSIVEMCYFFTIRLSLTIYRQMIGANTEPDMKPQQQQQQQHQRESERRRQQQRFQDVLAGSRKIYNISPVLNRYFREDNAQTQKKKGLKVVAW